MPTTLKRKKTTRTKKTNRKSVSLGRAYDDVRAKGILLKDGITYNRQKPITKMLKGKEITISFAFNRIVKGFYGIIEAENLQPSHSTGVQNPFHFLPEAQPRNRSTSQSGRETPQLIARNLRPAEIIEGANAYTGAPIANLRGEVIQGNGRADTLKIYYSLEPNGEVYKNYFFDGCNANFLGFSARTIKPELAKFKKPILGRFCDVSDEEFIQLGQFQAKDLEAVSSESSDTKARVNRISETDLAKMIDALLRYDKGDDSLTEIIRNSNALAYFVKAKVLRADELEKYTKNGQANAQGTEFVRQFLLQFLFEQGKDTKTSQKFENLPHHTQKGVEKSLLYVLKVHCYADCDSTDHSITKEVSNAIGAAYDFLQQSTFNFPAWVKQTPVFEPSPKDRFSPLELELAKVFSEGKTQKDIVDKFKKYAYYATDRPATMLEKEEKALSKNEALQKAFSISLSGLGCTSSCACQKKKGLNGCECDNENPTSSKEKDIILTVKLPVSINILQKYLWKRELANRDKNWLQNISEKEFIDIWKYTLAANTMQSDSIFPKTDNSNKHILHQVGSRDLVELVNNEFYRRNLTDKYTLFTERKENKTTSTPKKEEEKPKGQIYITSKGSNNVYYAIRVYRNGKSMGYYDAELYRLKTKPEFYVLSYLKDILESFNPETAYQKARSFKLDRKRKVEKYDAYATYEVTIVESIDNKVVSEKSLSEFQQTPTSTPKTEDISFNTKDYKYQLVNESNPKKLRLQSIGLVAGRPAGEIKQGDYLMWNFGEIEYVNDIKSETPKMLVIQTVSKNGYTGERKLLKSRLVCILEKKITSTSNEVEKEPYQMTFNAYMHLDKGYKKDFNRFINVEKEVEKERIFDKEKRAKAISWREKQYKILLNTTRELLRERHKYEVEKALSEGKTVPSEVLKDYPDLKQKPTSTPNETEDFELQLAIAKMKMLKLKAKALQLDELDGLYGLEYIYDDTELGGLDGLDGKDVYEIVNEKILETIQQGNLSWRQTWKVKSRGGAAANYDSKRAYTGANFFLLNFILPLMGEDFEYPYFLTFKQIQARKGKIKKGSKGYPIFYYNIVRKHNGKKISEDEYKRLKAMGVKSFEEMRFLKYYTVFNIAAVEDVEFDLSNLEKSEKVNYEYEAIEAAEKIYYNMPNKPRLKVDAKAYYSPSEDYVGMPPVVTFESPQNFYSVLYHEIVHSTKHASRLNDKTRGGKKFGDKEYALEELVAELGACYMCAESGILFHTIDNSAAYLSSWNKKLTKSIQEDKTFFLKAAARAQRASNYILDYDKNGVPAYQRNSHYEPIPLIPSTDKTPTKVIQSDEDDFELQLAISKMKMLKTKAKALQL